jgi:hypothetical protein
MFNTYIKNYQSYRFANNWQQTLQHKAMLKNSFRATGDIKKAKVFVKDVTNYSPHTHFAGHGEHVIFSFNPFVLEPEPAY